MKVLWMHGQERSATRPFNATWIIQAPWAHPFWSEYAALLFNLTTEIGKPARIYRQDDNYEFQLWALDPVRPFQIPAAGEEPQIHRLTPMNYGYQFHARSDDAARNRIDVTVVQPIVKRYLNPDTDHRQTWDDYIFLDGQSLHNGRLRGITPFQSGLVS